MNPNILLINYKQGKQASWCHLQCKHTRTINWKIWLWGKIQDGGYLGAVGCSIESERPMEASQRDADAGEESTECLVSLQQFKKAGLWGRCI